MNNMLQQLVQETQQQLNQLLTHVAELNLSEPLNADKLSSLTDEAKAIHEKLTALKIISKFTHDSETAVSKPVSETVAEEIIELRTEKVPTPTPEPEPEEPSIAKQESQLETPTPIIPQENLTPETPASEEADKEETPEKETLLEEQSDVEKEKEQMTEEPGRSSPNQKSEETSTIDLSVEPSLADKLRERPITDLTTAIGLNERFVFSNDLFDGNMEAFNQAVNELNHMENIDHAERFLNEQIIVRYDWDVESETVQNFIMLVKRRFYGSEK